MCRNIKTLFNFQPPATDEEIRAASPKVNSAAFDRAVEDVAASAPGGDPQGIGHRAIWLTNYDAGTISRIEVDDALRHCKGNQLRPLTPRLRHAVMSRRRGYWY